MATKKKKNLTINMTTIYLFIAFLFFVGALFFGTSKLFMAEDIPINQTPLNKQLDLRSDGKMKITSWVYDENKNKMEVILVTNGMKDYKSELFFSSVSREEVTNELPVNIVYNDNEIYVIEINEVEKGFSQIALRLHKNEDKLKESFDESFIEEDKNDGIFSNIYTDEREVKKSNIDEKNTSDYIIEITNKLMEDTNKEIKEIEKEVKNKEIIKVEIQKEINQLEDDLVYEKVDEQVKTSNDIDRLIKEIESIDKEIEDSLIAIKGLEKKLEKLNQRIKETEISNS